MAKKPSEVVVESKARGIGKIDRIDPGGRLEAPVNGWVSVLKAFNPLGTAAEAYAKTLAYRIEMKRLALEAERVEKQAEIAHNVIDKTFRLKLEELEQRRLQLDRFYDTVQQQLSHLHIERMKVLEMAELATRRALESEVSIEDRRLFKEMATEFTATIPQFGAQANQSLDALVKALPPVKMPARLLPSGD